MSSENDNRALNTCLQDIAILRNWKEEHDGEHETIWKKIDENSAVHVEFIRAIERLETKLTVYTSLGVGLGSLLGGIISAMIINFAGTVLRH